MSCASFPQRVSQPVAACTLLIIAAMAVPAPSVAQLPALQPGAGATMRGQANPLIAEAAYTLGAGDRVRLDIFNVPEYSGEFQVLIDGTLNLPVIGSVAVRGMTLQQATGIISNKYGRYVRRPIATLSLLAARPLKIGVSGEVNRPGAYTVNLTEGRQFPTVTEVIQLAGGIRQSANARQVQVRRQVSPTTEQVVTVNLMDLTQKGDLSQDLTLRDGDTVFIPTSTTVDSAEARQLASTSFAADKTQPLKVAVVGEVYRPGSYSVKAEEGSSDAGGKPPTVTQAIQVAGGIKPTADIRKVQLRRSTNNGSEQVIDVNLWELLEAGDLNQDVILQEGDTVVIPVADTLNPTEIAQLSAASFSPNLIKVNVVGEVEKPGAVEVPPNTPLNQAVLAAGGFNNRARKRSVELLRLNPDGTVTKRQIEIDFDQDVNDQSNPSLRNNDVVVVNRSGIAKATDTLGTVLSPLGGIFSLFNFLRIFR